MAIGVAFQGSLFSNHFFCDSVVDLDDWRSMGPGVDS